MAYVGLSARVEVNEDWIRFPGFVVCVLADFDLWNNATCSIIGPSERGIIAIWGEEGLIPSLTNIGVMFARNAGSLAICASTSNFDPPGIRFSSGTP